MAKSKMKFVVLLAVLISAGVFLPAVAKVTATLSAQQEQDSSILTAPEQAQNDGLDSQSESNATNQEFESLGGREFFYKMLLSLLLVIALGIAAVYFSKKLLPRFTNTQGKQIRVLETAYIAPRKGIHLIQAGTRHLLIASTNENITMLADITGSGVDETSANQTKSLGQVPVDFATQLKARS